MSWVKLVPILISITTVSFVSANARVSKSFVRGFLVGYAKGLQEGRQTPVVHQVACAFHPVAEHEPMLHEMMEPGYPPPPHMPPEPEHDGGYSSNHVTHASSSSSSGSGMHHGGSGGSSSSSEERRGPREHHHHHHHEDKKAAATNTITVGQIQKLPAPMTASEVINSLNSIQPRSQVLSDKGDDSDKNKKM